MELSTRHIVSLEQLIRLFKKNQWEQVSAMIVDAICDLEKAGAEFAAIAANTPHNAYDNIQRARLKKVGLLGTKPTMEYGFFQKVFQKCGIDTIIPDKTQRNYIDHTIWEKLSHGKITRDDRKKHKAIIKKLVNDGAEGVILGCTELPSLIKSEDSDVPLFDTTHIHAMAILDYAMEKNGKNKLRGEYNERKKNNIFLH